MLKESKDALEGEFNEKLEEAYAKLSDELKDSEGKAVQGYEEAYGVIEDLRNRLEVQREEFEQQLEGGYEEAYQMLLDERKKNENLETGMYEEYDGKVGEVKSFMIDKIDQFLHHKGQEIYEQAKRDVLNDPRMAGHKVAVERIAGIVTDYLSEEEAALAVGSKLDAAEKTLEELQGQKRVLESKIVRMDRENKQLNEAVGTAQKTITKQNQKSKEDSTITEQKERVERAKSVEGKGKGHTGDVEVIKERQDEVQTTDENNADDDALAESVGGVDLETLAILGGVSVNN